ncbi:hypothetical protein ACFV9C_33665 [Kribbella sp. NPDC059898]|uniref:hypothetical protein n=1 Tax=Kribbella sp. NPDC059898 TaxID=3346995 RepID=UPI003656E348
MSTQLQQEIDRWEAQLDDIAETGEADDWFLEERRLAEAQQTVVTYRGRILPLLGKPEDRFVATEIEHLVDRLEDLRNDLFRTVHPVTSHQEIAETVAALRALVQLALRLEPAS